MHTPNSKLLVTTVVTLALAGCATADKNMPPPPKPAPVAASAPPPPPPPPVEVAKAPTYIVEDVHFEFDQSALKPSAESTLMDISASLREHPDGTYEVAGFTDSIGSRAYNQGLSERRAQSVHRFLVDHGVDASRLNARGYGESNPVATNATAAGRAKNRRVEIRPSP